MVRILVVEDDTDMLKLMREAFEEVLSEESPQVEVVYAECGNQALRHVQQSTFDLISTDGRFPNVIGGLMLSSAGLELIPKLEPLGHKGWVVFYSNNDHQMHSAKSFVVNGRNVQAFDKFYFQVKQWAEHCVELASPK